MAQFQASKFYPENDSDRPKLESEFEIDSTIYVIKKVSFITISDLIKMFKRRNDPDKKGYDILTFKDHKSRPGVKWMIWGNKKQF